MCATYIGPQPVPQATQTRETFTATASQASFATGGYQAGYIDVFLNGVKLVDGTDFTATNGSDVVLTTGAASGDTLEVVAYSTYEVNSQNYTGGLTVSQSASGAGGWNEALVLKGTYPLLALHETTTDKYSRIGNDGDGSLQFFVNGTSGTVGTNAASIDPSGNLYLSGGVYLGGTGAANKLDDYEEGTWTPMVIGSATAGTYNGIARGGLYTKVGNLVTASFVFYGNSGTGSGKLNVTGFPFATSSSATTVHAIQYNGGLALPSGTGTAMLYMAGNVTVASIRCNNDTAASYAEMDYPTTCGYLRCTVTYLTS